MRVASRLNCWNGVWNVALVTVGSFSIFGGFPASVYEFPFVLTFPSVRMPALSAEAEQLQLGGAVLAPVTVALPPIWTFPCAVTAPPTSGLAWMKRSTAARVWVEPPKVPTDRTRKKFGLIRDTVTSK